MKFPWLKTYPDEIDWRRSIKALPLFSLLDQAAAKFPEHTAIDFLGKHYSYRELRESVDIAAKNLTRLGVKKGTRVGLLFPNCPQHVISYFAILKAGGVVVNLSPLLAPTELKEQIKLVGIEMVITLNLTVCYGKIANLVGTKPLKKVVIATLPEALPPLKAVLFSFLKKKECVPIPNRADHIRWNELMTDDGSVLTPAKIKPKDDIAVLQFTGGTTGTPKAAMLTHANLYANAVQCKEWCHSLEEGQETIVGVLPLFHVFAMTVIMNLGILLGARMVLHPRFELKTLLKDITNKKVTLLPGVPTLFGAIAHCAYVHNYNLTSLKVCISGGAPLPGEVKKAFDDITGCRLLEGYGLTEASPVTACNPLTGKQKLGIGLPFPATEFKIEDMKHRGKFLSTGKKGEICIRGPQVMKGYFNNPEETKKAIGKDGFLRTGDIGYMDKDGYFFIVDRLKELIITHGFNVYPRHVEEQIYQHPAVKEVAVIGVPHPKYGQAVCACIALKEGSVLNEEEIRHFLKDRLAKYEQPHQIEFYDSLPKTMVGKICKKDLKKK